MSRFVFVARVMFPRNTLFKYSHSHCFPFASHCAQLAVPRRWQFPKLMARTNYTASSGSRLPRTQTWLSHWPECRTEQEQPHRCSWLLSILLSSVTTRNEWLVEWFCWLCVLVSLSQGSKGLSLFYAEVSQDADGQLRGIEVQRLKDKLGTRQMPTAELLLDGLPAYRVRYMHTVIVYYSND